MLIVGLGNPDKKYENTYHNVGFMVIDKVLELLNKRLDKEECKALVNVSYKHDEKIVIAKPLTYMNLSGQAIRELVGKYRVDLSDVLVIYDDIDIPCGSVRVRKEGSSGTHNGMRNIVECLNSTKVPRVRVGIGKPEPPMLLADYVLSRVSGDNLQKLNARILSVAKSIVDYIENRDFERLSRDCSK